MLWLLLTLLLVIAVPVGILALVHPAVLMGIRAIAAAAIGLSCS